jgi:thiol-disulfide isomerase/thioredoxin
LTGKIKYLVDTEPPTAQFGNVKEDEVATRVIKITNNSETPLTLTMDETATSETFKSELNETVPGKEFELKVTAKPPYEPRLNRHTITLKTNVAEQDSITVLCLANNPPRLEVIPDSFRISKTDKPQTRRIRLRNNGETAVALKGATVENVENGAEWVKTREIAPGKQYEVTVTVPANFEPGENVAIVLQTDDTAKPELRIPVTALPTRQAAEAQPQQRLRPAERLKGTPSSGAEVASYKGDKLQVGGDSEKVQVAVFYASWCGFCKRALPEFQKLHETYKDNKNVEIIAINVDDRGEGKRAKTEEESIKHFEGMGLSMPMVLDSEKKLAPQFKVSSYPTTFLIGKDGKIEDVVMGAKPSIDKFLAEEVDLLLAGKPLPNAEEPAAQVDPAAGVERAAAGPQAPPARIGPARPDPLDGKSAADHGHGSGGGQKEAEPKHD